MVKKTIVRWGLVLLLLGATAASASGLWGKPGLGGDPPSPPPAPKPATKGFCGFNC